MHPEYKIVPATEFLVERFITTIIEGTERFRYFQQRPVRVINKHLITAIMIDKEDNPVAYGHLEKENRHLWLGIAVADAHVKKGLGKLMLQYLVNFARDNHEPVIQLAVDKNNDIARKLYQSAGFVVTREFPLYDIFEMKFH